MCRQEDLDGLRLRVRDLREERGGVFWESYVLAMLQNASTERQDLQECQELEDTRRSPNLCCFSRRILMKKKVYINAQFWVSQKG